MHTRLTAGGAMYGGDQSLPELGENKAEAMVD